MLNIIFENVGKTTLQNPEKCEISIYCPPFIICLCLDKNYDNQNCRSLLVLAAGLRALLHISWACDFTLFLNIATHSEIIPIDFHGF